MTTAINEEAERKALMMRLRELVSDWFACGYETSPLEHLRHAVKSCEEQEEFYRLCGLEDLSLQEPTKAARSALPLRGRAPNGKRPCPAGLVPC